MRHIKVRENQPPLRYFLQPRPNRITKFKSKITSLATTVLSFFHQHIRNHNNGLLDGKIEGSSPEVGNGSAKQGNQFKNNRLLIKASSKRGSRLIKFHEITSSQQEPPNIIPQQKPEMQINPPQPSPPPKKKQIKKTMTIYSTNNPQPHFSPPSDTHKNLRPISPDRDDKKIDEQKEDQINLEYSESLPQSDKNNSDVNFQFQHQNYVDVDPIDDPFVFTAKKRMHSVSNSKKSQSDGLRMFQVRENSGYCADVDDQQAGDQEKGPRKRFKHADQRLLSFLTEFNNKKMDIYEQLEENMSMMRQRYEQFCSKPQRSIHKLTKPQKQVPVQKASEGQVQQVQDSRKQLKKLNNRLQRIILRRNSTNKSQRLNAVQPIQIELKPKILDIKLQKILEMVRQKNQPEPTFSIPTITPNFTSPQPPLAPSTLLTNLPTTVVSPFFKSAVDSQPQPSKQSNSEISSNKKQSSSQNPSNIFFNRPSIPIINLSFPNAVNKAQSDKSKSQVDSNSKQNSSSIFGIGVAAGSAASGNSGSGKMELFGSKDGGFSFGLFGQRQVSDNKGNKQIEAKVPEKKQSEAQIQKPKEQSKKIQVQPIPTPSLTPPTQEPKQPKQPKQPQAEKNTAEINKNEAKKQEPPPIQENPFLKKPTVQKELLSGLISNFSQNPIFGNSKSSANIFNLMTQPAPAPQPSSSPFGLTNSPDKKEAIKNDFSTPTKNMLNTVQQVQNQPNIEPQDDESSMFDESEQSGSKRQSSIFGDFSRQSVVTPSPSLFNTVSNNGSFGSSLLNNSQMFQAAQVTQIDYLKSMPKVDIEKSLNLFGRSPSNDQGIFGSVDEGRRKQEPKHVKKKQKEQRVYGA